VVREVTGTTRPIAPSSSSYMRRRMAVAVAIYG
jgi:hypothetical protein